MGANKTSILGLFEVETRAKPAVQTALPASNPAAGSEEGPLVVSSLVPRDSVQTVSRRPRQAAPPSASAGIAPSSSKIAELVIDVQQHVPAGNATMKLIEAMKSIEAIVPDQATRKDAALKILATQGVTAQAVAEGEREVAQAIDRRLDELLAQSDTVRATQVEGKRAEAKALRDQTAENQRRVEAINAENADLERKATELDSSATTLETQLNQFRQDVEGARATARVAYGV